MNGIVTIAFGTEYDKIAAPTMRYSRQFTDLPICVLTNLEPDERSCDWEQVDNCNFSCPFHGCDNRENRRAKLAMNSWSEFDKTIYIDADALIQKSGIECIFDMLDQADFVFNGVHHWKSGERIPNIYAKAMLATGAKLPINIYSGGFFAWRNGRGADALFSLWSRFWKRTGSGRDMPALACAVQRLANQHCWVADVAGMSVFAPERKDEDCIIQHNYNDTFLKDFDLPAFQESKPFDSDPTDFRFTDFKRIVMIKSHNGIGDLLFATPAFRVIKEAYPDCRLIVNTNRPTLLQNNPYVDEVGTANEGVFLGYTAPDTGRLPTQHHVIEDWRIVCKEYNLDTRIPELRPELYVSDLPNKRDAIGVQILHKRLYHSKRVWQGFEELASRPGFEAIPEITEGDTMVGLVRQIASYKAVVCAEGGISHIAAALNVPAVVLFGGFSDPHWKGYPDHINIVSDCECKYCYNNKPCERDFECWKAISVDSVAEVALAHKKKYA